MNAVASTRITTSPISNSRARRSRSACACCGLDLLAVEPLDIEQCGEFVQHLLVVGLVFLPGQRRLLRKVFGGGLVAAHFVEDRGAARQHRDVEIVRRTEAVLGYLEICQLPVDDFQRLLVVVRAPVNRQFDLLDLVLGDIPAAFFPDFAHLLFGAVEIAPHGGEVGLGNPRAPDMLGEQDALFGHPERLFGLVVFLLLGVQLGELEVQVGGVDILQVVLLDHLDALEIGLDGRVVEGFGPVDVAQLFVGFGDRGLVVVADGLGSRKRSSSYWARVYLLYLRNR